MKKVLFTGSGVAIVTPFDENDDVNYDLLEKLIDFQIENGTDAIVICGTTGESSTLSDEEHVEAIKHTVDYVGGRVPVIAGTGSNETAYAIRLSNEAEAAGVDGAFTGNAILQQNLTGRAGRALQLYCRQSQHAYHSLQCAEQNRHDDKTRDLL